MGSKQPPAKQSLANNARLGLKELGSLISEAGATPSPLAPLCISSLTLADPGDQGEVLKSLYDRHSWHCEAHYWCRNLPVRCVSEILFLGPLMSTCPGRACLVPQVRVPLPTGTQRRIFFSLFPTGLAQSSRTNELLSFERIRAILLFVRPFGRSARAPASFWRHGSLYQPKLIIRIILSAIRLRLAPASLPPLVPP